MPYRVVVHAPDHAVVLAERAGRWREALVVRGLDAELRAAHLRDMLDAGLLTLASDEAFDVPVEAHPAVPPRQVRAALLVDTPEAQAARSARVRARLAELYPEVGA